VAQDEMAQSKLRHGKGEVRELRKKSDREERASQAGEWKWEGMDK